MTFAVTWATAAIARYNQMLAAADDPARIVQAAAWMDQSLRRHPFDLGESRSTPEERLWYEDVLGMYFRADRDAMTVRVISVGPARRR